LKSVKIPRLAVPQELVYRLFYPQIPLIISAKFRGIIAAMPAVSCMSVSNAPPVIAVSVGRSLRTDLVMKKAKNFALSWVDFRYREIVKLLSMPGKKTNKLKEVGVPYMNLLGTPVPRAAIAYAICEKKKVIEVGDHDLFMGRVIGSMASLDFDEYWKFSEYRPILYRGSAFRSPFTTVYSKHSGR
jgi:flavin reductase (DIM6/NTAB) family NADH-FMN oxidoreductase RutF